MYSDQILLIVGGCTWRFDCIILKQRHNFENVSCLFVYLFVFFWGGRVGGGGGSSPQERGNFICMWKFSSGLDYQAYNHH